MQRLTLEVLVGWGKAIKIPHHDTQNEIIRLMAFLILRDIAKKYQR